MDTEEITFKVKYTEGMTMEELVNAINKANENLMTAFNASMKYHFDLMVGEMNKMKCDIADTKSDVTKILNHFNIK